jgi:hypothetical protein
MALNSHGLSKWSNSSGLLGDRIAGDNRAAAQVTRVVYSREVMRIGSEPERVEESYGSGEVAGLACVGSDRLSVTAARTP